MRRQSARDAETDDAAASLLEGLIERGGKLAFRLRQMATTPGPDAMRASKARPTSAMTERPGAVASALTWVGGASAAALPPDANE